MKINVVNRCPQSLRQLIGYDETRRHLKIIISFQDLMARKTVVPLIKWRRQEGQSILSERW